MREVSHSKLKTSTKGGGQIKKIWSLCFEVQFYEIWAAVIKAVTTHVLILTFFAPPPLTDVIQVKQRCAGSEK